MPVNVKTIRERVIKMNDAWAQGAPTVAFKGRKQLDFQAKILAAAAADREIAAMEAQIAMKRDHRDTLYSDLQDESVEIRQGVEGHEDFGQDHPIFEAMGFVRDSQRKSGLTRKRNLTAKS